MHVLTTPRVLTGEALAGAHLAQLALGTPLSDLIDDACAHDRGVDGEYLAALARHPQAWALLQQWLPLAQDHYDERQRLLDEERAVADALAASFYAQP